MDNRIWWIKFNYSFIRYTSYNSLLYFWIIIEISLIWHDVSTKRLFSSKSDQRDLVGCIDFSLGIKSENEKILRIAKLCFLSENSGWYWIHAFSNKKNWLTTIKRFEEKIQCIKSRHVRSKWKHICQLFFVWITKWTHNKTIRFLIIMIIENKDIF